MTPLTPEEIRFFTDEGYLIKRGVLDPHLMARARDCLWQAPPPSLKRHDPSTWVGPIPELEEDEDGGNYRKNFRWQYRKPGDQPWMVELLPKNAQLWAWAEQMLGPDTLVEPPRIRGIYCTLPYGDQPRKSTGCHCDGHPFNLGVVGYIDDVPPDGGGFAVWPGSHRSFYYDFKNQYRRDPTDQYEIDRERFSEKPPVDAHGRAGDILFWHHRLGHMANHNYSGQIRQAVLYDYIKRDVAEKAGAENEGPPRANMWADWSDQVQALAAA